MMHSTQGRRSRAGSRYGVRGGDADLHGVAASGRAGALRRREQSFGLAGAGFEPDARRSSRPSARVDTLKSWMADMKTGERLTFTHKPGSGIQVDIGGATKGTIKGADFARAFLP